MGGITATVPQQQLPDYVGTLSQAAQVLPRNALINAQTASTEQDARQKAYTFAADTIGSNLYAVMQAPQDQREQAYQQAKDTIKRAGIDTSGMPANYDQTFINNAMVRALGIMNSYNMGMTRAVVGALGGAPMTLPPVPGQPPTAAAPSAPAPTQGASDQAAPANALNARPAVPGAGPGMALSYLIDPKAAAQEISDQMKPVDLRPGGYYLNSATGREFGVPEAQEGGVYDASTNTMKPVAGAAAVAATMKQASELGGKRGELGGEYEGQVRDDATGAVQHQAILQQMRQELSGITSFDPGTFGTLKGKTSKLFASVFGDKDKGSGQDGSAANFQEFQKNSIQLALAQAKSMSPREAFQGVLFVQQGNPNFDMTRDGIEGVIGQMQGLDQYKIAKAQALANWHGDPNKFETYWQKATDPTVFMFNNASDRQKQQMLSGLSKPQKIQFLHVYRNTRDMGWLPPAPQ